MAEKSRVDRLIEVRDSLAEAIENCTSTRDLPALSREYRAVIAELEALQAPEEHDAIDEIIAQLTATPAPNAEEVTALD